MNKLNLRPFMDALRANGGAWDKRYDSRHRDGRTVGFSMPYRGMERVWGTEAELGDRFLEMQFNEDGRHRVSHMLVTKGGPISLQGPRFMRGTTYPTYFETPGEMLLAIKVELHRADHAPSVPDHKVMACG